VRGKPQAGWAGPGEAGRRSRRRTAAGSPRSGAGRGGRCPVDAVGPGVTDHRVGDRVFGTRRDRQVQGGKPVMSITVTARNWKLGWELILDDHNATQVRTLAQADAQVRDYLDTVAPDIDHTGWRFTSCPISASSPPRSPPPVRSPPRRRRPAVCGRPHPHCRPSPACRRPQPDRLRGGSRGQPWTGLPAGLTIGRAPCSGVLETSEVVARVCDPTLPVELERLPWVFLRSALGEPAHQDACADPGFQAVVDRLGRHLVYADIVVFVLLHPVRCQWVNGVPVRSVGMGPVSESR
jgi:hypothetical protein